MSTREGKFVSCLLIVLLPILCIGGIIWHYKMQNQIAEFKTEAHRLSQENKVVEKFQRSVVLGKAMKETELRLKRARTALPNYIETDAFLRDLEMWGALHRVELISIAPGELEQEEDWGEQKIKLRLRGSYFDLMDFLTVMENGGRLVNFGQGECKLADNKIELATEIYIYAQK